jgi:hypothetical protein
VAHAILWPDSRNRLLLELKRVKPSVILRHCASLAQASISAMRPDKARNNSALLLSASRPMLEESIASNSIVLVLELTSASVVSLIIIMIAPEQRMA